MRPITTALLLAACGPSLPPASTEGGTSTTESSTTTSDPAGSGGETGAATSGLTTTSDAPTTSGAASSSTDATEGPTSGPTSTGGTATGDPTGTTGGAATSCCEVPGAANAEVTGATPQGPIALTWAWFGIQGGECGGRTVLALEDPGQLGGAAGPRLEIFLNDTLATPGTFPAWFSVTGAMGKQAFVEGFVDVAAASTGPFEPQWCAPGDPVVMTDATIELSFSVLADGWNLTGEVAAIYCPPLNVFCP